MCRAYSVIFLKKHMRYLSKSYKERGFLEIDKLKTKNSKNLHF